MRSLGKRSFNGVADDLPEIRWIAEWIIYRLRSIFAAFGTGSDLQFGKTTVDSGGLAMFRNTPACFRCLTRQISRFVRTERGATAVEFALIAPAFLATLLAILEVTIFLFAQMALQDAANQAARYFLTGQAQNNNWSATTVVGKVCPAVVFNCTNVFIAVQNSASFSGANTAPPSMYDSGGNLLTQGNYTYDPGTPGNTMVVQLVYAWPVVPGPLGFNLGPVQHGAVEIMGVSAFRVEPYSG